MQAANYLPCNRDSSGIWALNLNTKDIVLVNKVFAGPESGPGIKKGEI